MSSRVQEIVHRRELLASAAAGIAGTLTAMGDVSAKDLARKPAFVLIHGWWHGAWCFSKLVPYLLKAGHVVAARDLPGHGGLAKNPKSFGPRPLDTELLRSNRLPWLALRSEITSPRRRRRSAHCCWRAVGRNTVGSRHGGIPHYRCCRSGARKDQKIGLI